jgi:hypothetical protein
LSQRAKLSAENGGIGHPLAGLYKAIVGRFGAFPQFKAWMKGEDEPEVFWTEKVRRCTAPDDFLKLFLESGVPGEKWKTSHWLAKTAALPEEQGGIGRTLCGLSQAIGDRFGGYLKFVAWMEGTDKVRTTLMDDVNGCATSNDFIILFRKMGIKYDGWKNSGWLVENSYAGLAWAIRTRFGGHKQFVAWMQGKDKPEDSWVEKVNKCSTPDDFLKIFSDSGIPGDKWKKANWLSKVSLLPEEQGGIGCTLSGLCQAIGRRFGGHPQFVAWMEGRTLPAVPKIETPEDAARVIREQALAFGITTDELLNPEAISLYIRKNPALKEALKFFK